MTDDTEISGEEFPQDPVDPYAFVAYLKLFRRAALGIDDVCDVACVPEIPVDEDGCCMGTDSLKRGLSALAARLKEDGVTTRQAESVMFRVCHFAELTDHREHLSDFFRGRFEDGTLQINAALVGACAMARLVRRDSGVLGFDLDDVDRIARQLWVLSETQGTA